MGEERTCFITDGILVVEQIPFLEINELEIKGQVNEHASLRMRGKVPESKERQLALLTSYKTEIVLKTRQEMVLFRGVLKELDVEHSGGLIIVGVKALSHSCLFDGKKKKRPFHNTKAAVKDIIRAVSSDTKSSDVIIGDECACETGSFLMQYDETDWEFLKRVASLAEQTLIPDITVAYPAFYAGKPKEIASREILEPDSYSMIYDEGNMYRIRSRRDWMWLGDKVRFQGLDLYVRKVSVKLQQAVLCGVYELCFRDGLNTKREENESLAGKSVEGMVQKISRDQVLVNVNAADGNDNGESCWFPYSTVYASADGSGWYCMPEKGDQVRVYFPTNQEKDAYAVSAISGHEPEPGDAEDPMGNPNVKYLRTKADQVIQFAEDGIIINSGSGQATIFLGNSGELTVYGSTDVNVTAQNTLSLISNGQVLVGATDSITMKKGEGTFITMDKEGDITLKGSKIYSN